MGTKRLFQPNEVHKDIKSKKAQIVATTSTTQSSTTTTKMSYSNKHSGLCSSRTSKSKKTSSKYYQNSNKNIRRMKYTIYAQNLFIDNCFISSLDGDFDIEKQHHQGDLYKTASKTTIKNLAFEKYSQNNVQKLKIMEHDNPTICDPNEIAVYNLSMQNQEVEKQGKYQRWQKIDNSSIILTNDVNSFGGLGGAFDKNHIHLSCKYVWNDRKKENCIRPSCMNCLGKNSKINALTPDAFGSYANGGERYVGNLVLNNLGYDSFGKIQIKSVTESDQIYTTHKNEKLDLLEVKALFSPRPSETCTGKEFCILTPRIMIKRSEMEKSNSLDFTGAKNKACSNMVYSLKHLRNVGKKLENNKFNKKSSLPENVNRSPETVVEPTRNDWKHEADKQKSRANKVFLSKIKKNKTLSKYQTTVCF